jgi:hypothetical protein
MHLHDAFEQFIKHGLYLRGWSPRTVHTYRQGFSSLQQSLREDAQGDDEVLNLSKAQLEAWVIWMRERGLSPGGANMGYRRAESVAGCNGVRGKQKQRLCQLRTLRQLARSPDCRTISDWLLRPHRHEHLLPRE